MSSVQIQIPSKTFLVGEYAALVGGSAVVINSRPCFEATLHLADASGEQHPFHPESPAGKYYSANSGKFLGKLEWSDPHRGKGGFGGSSAQFLVMHFWSKLIQTKLQQFDDLQNTSETETFALRDQLLNFSGLPSEGVKPSGYDLVSQMTGELALIDGEKRTAKALGWSFVDKEFLILRTGLKVNTHDHLAEFSEINFSSLSQISYDVGSSLVSNDYLGVVGGVTEFQRELRRRNLTHQNAYDILQKFLDLCDGGKCCGALGADSILLFYSTDKALAVRQRLLEVNRAFGLQLAPIAGSGDLVKVNVNAVLRERTVET
jgi:mevalonate kinase